MDGLELVLACDRCFRDTDTIGPYVQPQPDGSTTLGVQCRWCAIRPWWRDLGPYA